jgi:hypothetical protein
MTKIALQLVNIKGPVIIYGGSQGGGGGGQKEGRAICTTKLLEGEAINFFQEKEGGCN